MKKFLRFILSVLLAAVAAVSNTVIVTPVFAAEEDDYSIKGYAGTGSFSLYLNGENKLYAVGENGAGQLGIGTVESHFDPQYVMDDVLQVAVGGDLFAFALKQDGLYAWGKNQYGQLGLGGEYNSNASENYVSVPNKVELGFSVKQIVCGKSFTLLLDESGDVWAAGSNQYGQLGLPSTYKKTDIVSSFTKITALDSKDVVQLAAAEYTSYALTESGEIFSFGDNYYGELGSGSEVKHPNDSLPVNVLIDEKIIGISAGGSNAMALTESGKVYIWGRNQTSQLGVQVEGNAIAPVLMNEFFDAEGNAVACVAVDILCGGNSNFIISEDKKIYSFGANSDNNCGINNDRQKVERPTQITFYKALDLREMKKNGASDVILSALPVDMETVENVEIVSFLGGSASRVFVQDSSGTTWSFGSNNAAQLCSGNTATATVPVRSTLYRVQTYDGEYEKVDYLTRPIIVLCIIFGLLIVFIVWQEIKIRKRVKSE